jgi:hypothetical protein
MQFKINAYVIPLNMKAAPRNKTHLRGISLPDKRVFIAQTELLNGMGAIGQHITIPGGGGGTVGGSRRTFKKKNRCTKDYKATTR